MHATAALCCGIIIILSMTGCYGGARGIVRFNELDYPASMSPYLYGPNNEILVKDRDLSVIKPFRLEVIYTAIFYSLVSLAPDKDVGEQINASVDSCGGDGVVNVKIRSKPGLTNYMHPLTLLPFWPSYTTVVVEGYIVKYEPSVAKNASKMTAFVTSGDVLIIEPANEDATVPLHARCQVINRVDTLFAADYFDHWVSNNGSWRTVYSADSNDSEKKITMQDHLKMLARRTGADVIQILYVTSDGNEVRAKYKKAKPDSAGTQDFTKYIHSALGTKQSDSLSVSNGVTKTEPESVHGDVVGVALDVRYWSCPANQ